MTQADLEYLYFLHFSFSFLSVGIVLPGIWVTDRAQLGTVVTVLELDFEHAVSVSPGAHYAPGNTGLGDGCHEWIALSCTVIFQTTWHIVTQPQIVLSVLVFGFEVNEIECIHG
jgi:hypothetical protein